jgi:hypoxanthine phosphoribosyltransferase
VTSSAQHDERSKAAAAAEPRPAPSNAARPGVRDVHLDEFGSLARQLAQQVTASGYEPDCIVYLESGGRLLAAELCGRLGVGAVALQTSRRGGSIKRRLRPLATRLPDELTDLMRRVESRWLSGWLRPSAVELAQRPVRLDGARVLIVDDAVDTGASVDIARTWALSHGATESAIRIAAITVTSDRVDGVVDYHVHQGLCRFPWSSDSDEHTRYLRMAAGIEAPPYQGPSAIAGGR